jgi:PASTA domain
MPERWVNPHGWGPPRPPRADAGRPWWRHWQVLLAAAAVVLGGVALGDDGDPEATADRATTPPTTAGSPLSTVATTRETTTSTAPPSTIATVEVPELVGMPLASAKVALAERELRGTIRYRTTGRHRAGTVISQSRTSGAAVAPDSTITLVVAKAPPPPPPTAPPPPPPSPAPGGGCDPSYPDECLDPSAEDYDCAGGSGNGPEYVEGPLRVRPPDPFGLDADGDGWGCESG